MYYLLLFDHKTENLEVFLKTVFFLTKEHYLLLLHKLVSI